jgi:2-hydroxy-3-keto-5-methylthiopentenyl-1-phosphate phosphatase
VDWYISKLTQGMLGVLSLKESEVEQDRIKDTLESQYRSIKLGGLDQESLGRIDKDVERTDRSVFYPGDHSTPISALPRYNFLFIIRLELVRRILISYCNEEQVEYVQGMNDLCAPLVYVIQDESLCYFAFKNLMTRISVFLS